MINVEGYELKASDIILCIIVAYIIIKKLAEFFMNIKAAFDVYHSNETKKENLDTTVKNHSEELNSVINSIQTMNDHHDEITTMLKDQTQKIKELDESIEKITERQTDIMTVQKMQLRHSIVRSCEEYLSRPNKEIESKELQSLEDLNSAYTNILNGNSYVKVLMNKVATGMTVVTKYSHDDE